MFLEPSTKMEVAALPAGFDRPVRELVRWSGGGIVALLAFTAAVLCWRRLAGALSSPLALPAMLAVGLLVSLSAVAGRVAWKSRPAPRRSTRSDRLAGLALSVAVLVVGIAVSLPGTSHTGLVALWCILAAEEIWAWSPKVWRRMAPRTRKRPSGEKEIGVDLSPTAPAASLRSIPSAPVLEKPPAEGVTQQLIRRQAADGSDVLSGWLRVSVSAGQRISNVHVAFCPPFQYTPRVTVEQLEGPKARIKTVQLLPFGARFDLKLASQSESRATVLLQFSAETTPSGATSAD